MNDVSPSPPGSSRAGSEPPPPTAVQGAAPFRPSNPLIRLRRSVALRLLLTGLITLAGLVLHWPLVAVPAALLLLALCLAQLLPDLWRLVADRIDEAPTARLLAVLGLVVALLAVPLALGWLDGYLNYYRNHDWEAIGALGEGVIGAFGQILVALVAVAIAWRQVLIEQRLTTQQNRITQAQTIDSFIQGISELIVDEEGMLEDWPLERMLAEGRLAAVFGSIDTEGRARVLRFLSHARLLTPLRRDNRLGRPILDGHGNYEEDRTGGVPVIQLNTILKGVDLSGTDLRGVDFNGADLRNSDLADCDLRGANLAGANLAGANLEQARLEDTRFFYGRAQTASPSRPDQPLDLQSGRCSGAVVENANFSGVQRLDPESHHYLASWSGHRSRASLPGGSRGIASRLETP
ncbi:MAG: pentapeptide repeat-containing protein [Cyanobacteriota bacterium]